MWPHIIRKRECAQWMKLDDVVEESTTATIPVKAGIWTSSSWKRTLISPSGGNHKPQIGWDLNVVSEGPLSFCYARSRPLRPAAASPEDRQMKCWKASLKTFASHLKALGTRMPRRADLARISCWMLPRGEVRLQGQAVDKAAQSGAALVAAPDHVYSLTLVTFKTAGATERAPLILHVRMIQMECAQRKCFI